MNPFGKLPPVIGAAVLIAGAVIWAAVSGLVGLGGWIEGVVK